MGLASKPFLMLRGPSDKIISSPNDNLHSEFTSTIVSLAPSAELTWLRPWVLCYLEGELLDLVLRLPPVLVLEVDVTLPSPRIFLLQAVNHNAAGVLYVALSRRLQGESDRAIG